MLDTGQKLATAIDELTKLSTDQPATLEDLVALSAARDCIDELFRACTEELRNDPRVAPMWEAIAVATKLQPQRSPGRQKSAIYQPEDHVELFWATFAGRFTWDFLPVDFLHALYIQWLSEQHPRVVALSKYTLTRRLKCAAAKSGDWFHTRARPGTLMKAREPLTARVPGCPTGATTAPARPSTDYAEAVSRAAVHKEQPLAPARIPRTTTPPLAPQPTRSRDARSLP